MQPINPSRRNAPPPTAEPDVPFGSNNVRLSVQEWVVAAALIGALLYFIPVVWQRIEPFEPGPDHRTAYRLGNDYWMYDRLCRTVGRKDATLVVGDSVVWGHYVGKDQTLSHYLSQRLPEGRFANLGVDGIHPAAMAGLIQYYGRHIAHQDVILHCNLLWISSKRHDLQIRKEFAFNHPPLVPQFSPRIPCYKESFPNRLAIAVQRKLPYCGWANHLQIAYLDNTDLPRWTIGHPYRSPADAVTLELPSPDEPPSPVPVAESWTARGISKSNFPWVELETSFQWSCFKQLIGILQRRGNRVFVLVGPLNEHMLTDESLMTYTQRKHEVAAWLEENRIPHYVPAVLPSELYADASHPLAAGYAMLAEELSENESFHRFRWAEKPNKPE